MSLNLIIHLVLAVVVQAITLKFFRKTAPVAQVIGFAALYVVLTIAWNAVCNFLGLSLHA